MTYKIYVEIVRYRLEKKVNRVNLLTEEQAGFSKGRSTINNIFVLFHVTQRETREGGRGRKIYADLKTAIGNMDRELVWKIRKETK